LLAAYGEIPHPRCWAHTQYIVETHSDKSRLFKNPTIFSSSENPLAKIYYYCLKNFAFLDMPVPDPDPSSGQGLRPRARPGGGRPHRRAAHQGIQAPPQEPPAVGDRGVSQHSPLPPLTPPLLSPPTRAMFGAPASEPRGCALICTRPTGAVSKGALFRCCALFRVVVWGYPVQRHLFGPALSLDPTCAVSRGGGVGSLP